MCLFFWPLVLCGARGSKSPTPVIWWWGWTDGAGARHWPQSACIFYPCTCCDVKPHLNGPKTSFIKTKWKWNRQKSKKRHLTTIATKRPSSSVVCSRGRGGYGRPPASARCGFQLKPRPPDYPLLTTDRSVLWFTGEFKSRRASTQTYLGLSLRF